MRWFSAAARDLPWRKTRDPYRIWISEVMLQQTTVTTVIPYYERWVKKFPDVQSVARAPLQKILRTWQGLGYYQRAKNIRKCAQILCERFQGQLPARRDDLRSLPGFGPYTTGAVLSIAFDQRQPIIDANVRRVVMRLLALQGQAGTRHDAEIVSYLDRVMPARGNRIFNQAMMELGALVCRSRQPMCLACPVRIDCRAYQDGIQEMIPTPKKTVLKKIDAVIAVIEKNHRFYIQKRDSHGLFADLWEFPGGKIEKGETPQAALSREVREELGINVCGVRPLFTTAHFYTQFKVTLHVMSCRVKQDPVHDETHRWVSRNRLTHYPMPSGSAKIVDRLLKMA